MARRKPAVAVASTVYRHRGTFEHKFTNNFLIRFVRETRGKRKCFFGDKLCRGRSVYNAETCSKRDFRGNSPSSRSILVNFADEHVGKFVRRVWLQIGNLIAPFWALGRRVGLVCSSPQQVSLMTWFISHTFNAPRRSRTVVPMIINNFEIRQAWTLRRRFPLPSTPDIKLSPRYL